MFVPKGFITLRATIIRLAELRAPNVDLQVYLNPPAKPTSLLSDATAFAKRWHDRFKDDPFEWPFPSEEAPGWLALKAARAEVRQALGDGNLLGYRPNLEGNPQPLSIGFWRNSAGYSALRSGTTPNLADDGVAAVLLQALDFERWSKPLQPSHEAIRRWVENEHAKGAKYDDLVNRHAEIHAPARAIKDALQGLANKRPVGRPSLKHKNGR